MIGDDRSQGQSDADKLDADGAEPSVESGAGYGDHAPSPEQQDEEEK